MGGGPGGDTRRGALWGGGNAGGRARDPAAGPGRRLPLAQALRRTVGEPQVGRLVTEALDATAEPAVAPSR